MFILMCLHKARNTGDVYRCEYNGVKYQSKEKAEREFRRAKHLNPFSQIWIEETV